MKISEALLMEAIQFRSSDFKLVDSKAKDFSIGIEYEIHIKKEYLDGGDDGDDEETEYEIDIVSYEMALAGARDEAILQVMRKLKRNIVEFGDRDIILYLHIYIQKLKEVTAKISGGELFDTKFTKNDISNIFGSYELDSLVGDLKGLANSIPETLPVMKFLSGFTNNVDILTVIGDINEFRAIFTNMSDDDEIEATDIFHLITILTAVENIKNWLWGLDVDKLQAAVHKNHNNYQFFLEMDREAESNIDIHDFETRISSGNGSSASAVAFAEDNIPESVKKFIERIEIDPSVSSGCEVITNPLSIHDALFVMKEMFKFIKQYGFSSNKTGMHVNISHRLMQNEMSLDGLKLMILADPDYHQGFTKRNDRQMWRPREYVSTMTSRLKSQSVIDIIAAKYHKYGISGIEVGIDVLINQREKYQAINLAHSNLSDVTQRRIEFRYFGGEGYEDKFNIIRSDIYYLCYILIGAVDENFLKKEYHQELFKYIDRISKEVYYKPFLDVVAGYNGSELNQKISRKS